MPEFTYRAVDKNGVIVRNRVEDVSKQALIKRLKHNDLMPISVVSHDVIRKTGKTRARRRNINNVEEILKNVNTANLAQSRGKKVSTIDKINMALSKTEPLTIRDLSIFTQNFYLLKKANFNNIHALSTILESTENLTLRTILEDIIAGVEAGENMYVTMEYYSNIFPNLFSYVYVNMIKVGELSGSLTNSLMQAVKYLDDTEKLKRRLRSILLPNIIQFVLLIVLLIAGTLVAIPAIQSVFDAVGTTETLPAITIWFSNFVDGVIAHWYIPVAIIAVIAAAIIFYIHTPKGQYNFDYFKYVMPVFGKLIYSIDFTRLMRAMLLNLQNGMRIQDSLEVSKNVVQNYVMLSIVETAINNIYVGGSWIEPFEKAGLSSAMTTEMLKIGMQTDLSEMMQKLLEYMEIDMDNTMEKIMKTLPQIVYVIVGIVLIFFVLVVLVPCIQLYMGTFLFSAAGV